MPSNIKSRLETEITSTDLLQTQILNLFLEYIPNPNFYLQDRTNLPPFIVSEEDEFTYKREIINPTNWKGFLNGNIRQASLGETLIFSNSIGDVILKYGMDLTHYSTGKNKTVDGAGKAIDYAPTQVITTVKNKEPFVQNFIGESKLEHAIYLAKVDINHFLRHEQN